MGGTVWPRTEFPKTMNTRRGLIGSGKALGGGEARAQASSQKGHCGEGVAARWAQKGRSGQLDLVNCYLQSLGI